MRSRPCPAAGVGRGGGVSWHARRAVRFGGQRRFPRHHPRLRIADPGDPMGRHRLYSDLCGVDAGVRPARRHARPSARVLAGQRRAVPSPSWPAPRRRRCPGCWRRAWRRASAPRWRCPAARRSPPRCIPSRSAAGFSACTRWFSASAGPWDQCSRACWCSGSAGSRCSGSAPRCRSRLSCSRGDCPPRCPPVRASASTRSVPRCWCWRPARCCSGSTACSRAAARHRSWRCSPWRRLASSCRNAAPRFRSSTCAISAMWISRC